MTCQNWRHISLQKEKNRYNGYMRTRIEVSNWERQVNRNILKQIGLHNETSEALARKIKRSGTYVRNRREGKNAWSIADVEALSKLWGLPLQVFFEDC